MKFISLFAGIGGFDLALTRQGHECVWANEWDKYAAQIYDKNFKGGKSLQGTEWGGIQSTGVESNPEIRGSRQSKSWGYRQLQQSKNFSENTQSLSEVKQNSQGGNGTSNQDRPDSLLFGHSQSTGNRIDTRDIRTVPTEEIPGHDLLVGGFPCQAFSIAGKRKGFDDTRGTLFFEIARILREKHPRLFILENVKGLLSHDNGNTFKTIISTLDELGYDLQWQVLNSKNFGVPQNRERVFIIGNLRGTSRPQVFPVRNTNENNSQPTKELPEQISNTLRTNYSNGKSNETYVGEGKEIKIRRLTPTECERLQGFPDDWTEGISDTQRYKCLGNAVTVNVVNYLVSKL